MVAPANMAASPSKPPSNRMYLYIQAKTSWTTHPASRPDTWGDVGASSETDYCGMWSPCPAFKQLDKLSC